MDLTTFLGKKVMVQFKMGCVVATAGQFGPVPATGKNPAGQMEVVAPPCLSGTVVLIEPEPAKPGAAAVLGPRDPVVALEYVDQAKRAGKVRVAIAPDMIAFVSECVEERIQLIGLGG